MKIIECLWLDEFVDKIIRKHKVSPDEIEEVLSGNVIIRKIEGGRVKGEDLYIAFGKTFAGRRLTILFVKKLDKRALIISARDMTKRERKTYEKR
jgi:uncharacterized DUF497 family protein